MTVFLLRILFSPYLLFRIILRKPMLLILVFMVIGLVNYYQACTATTRPNIPAYQENAPRGFTPIVTKSRIYYSNDFTVIKVGVHDQYTLTEYFVFEKGKWERILRPDTDPLVLNEEFYGEITIYEKSH